MSTTREELKQIIRSVLPTDGAAWIECSQNARDHRLRKNPVVVKKSRQENCGLKKRILFLSLIFLSLLPAK